MGYKADQMVSWNRNENSTENAIQHVIHQKPEQTRAYLITSASPPFCRMKSIFKIHRFKWL